MNSASDEFKVANISEDRGMKFPRPGISFDKDSISELPKDIAVYWNRKLMGADKQELERLASDIIQKYGDTQ